MTKHSSLFAASLGVLVALTVSAAPPIAAPPSVDGWQVGPALVARVSEAGEVEAFAPRGQLFWQRPTGATLRGLQWVESPTVSKPLPDEPVAFGNEQGVFTVHHGQVQLLDAEGTEPLVGPTQERVLYRRSSGAEPGFDNELWTAPSCGVDAPERLIAHVPATKGKSGHFAEAPSWGQSGAWVVYTEVHYAQSGHYPALCTEALCPGEAMRTVMLQRLNPATGTSRGAPLALGAGTLGSLSPDERFVAFVSGNEMRVKEIDPLTGEATGAVVSHSLTGALSASERHRPSTSGRRTLAQRN